MLYGVIGKHTKEIKCVILYLDMFDYLDLAKISKLKFGHLKLTSQLATYSQRL
jgi:hypothetical protein